MKPASHILSWLFLLNALISPAVQLLLQDGKDSCTKIIDLGKNSNSRRVLCQRNKLKDIPLIKNPDEVSEFRLDENEIQNLHDNSFIRYTNVTYLSLEVNHLEHISENAFRPLKKLERLDIQKNYLSITNNSFLLTLDKLQILNMGGNRFLELKASFFKPLTSLLELNLEGTHRMEIHEGAFTGLYKLTSLNLNNCKLKTLANTGNMAKDFSIMPLKEINLGGNDWECDCKLRWIAAWYKEKIHERNDIQIKGNPLCKSPEPNPDMKYSGMKDKKLLDTTMTPPTKFQCQPIVYPPKYPNTVKHAIREGGNVTMTCDIYCDPKGSTIWSRDNTKILATARYIMTQTTGSTNYSASLTILNAEAEDAGMFTCRAINTRGQAELQQVLSVQVVQKAMVNRRVVIIIGITAVIVVTCTLMIGGVFFYHYSRTGRPIRKTPAQNSQGNYRQVPPQDTRRQGNVRYVELPPSENGYANAEGKKRLLLHDGVDAQAVPLTAEVNLDSDTERAKMPSGYMTIRPATSRTSTLPHGHSHSDGSGCPVHGSRQMFGCPVHGESRSATPQMGSGHLAYGTLPATGRTPNYNPPGKPGPCPLHGDFISTMTRRPHSPPSAADLQPQGTPGPFLRQKQVPGTSDSNGTPGQASATYVRASKVDDCISIPESAELPPPPPHPIRPPHTVGHPGQKANPQDDEGYSTAV